MGRTVTQWSSDEIDTQEMTSGYQKWKYTKEGSSGAPSHKGQILRSDILILVSS